MTGPSKIDDSVESNNSYLITRGLERRLGVKEY